MMSCSCLIAAISRRYRRLNLFSPILAFTLANLTRPGSALCPVALWDWFEEALETSFIGCYEVSRETGSEFLPKTVP